MDKTAIRISTCRAALFTILCFSALLAGAATVTVDCDAETLHLHVDEATLVARSNAPTPAAKSGWGRELFATFRDNVSDADCGASIFGN